MLLKLRSTDLFKAGFFTKFNKYKHQLKDNLQQEKYSESTSKSNPGRNDISSKYCNSRLKISKSAKILSSNIAYIGRFPPMQSLECTKSSRLIVNTYKQPSPIPGATSLTNLWKHIK